MKYSILLFIPLFALCLRGNTQHTDGPYVFHNGSHTIAKTILNDSFLTDTVQATNTIRVPTPLGQSFQVTLRINHAPPPTAYLTADTIMVLSDIEGEWAALYNLLLANGVMDKGFSWIFGSGHLVICGDVFDRGSEVVPVLWLLYHLEGQAEKKGGRLHLILGNHDIMNLSGDYRYVHAAYQKTVYQMSLPYSRFFAEDTELGRWLRTKNIIEKIGDGLYLHGGIAPEITRIGFSAEQMNELCRPWYSTQYYDSLPVAVKPFFSDFSPFWYRGYLKAPKATDAQVDSTLHHFGVKKIFVGHTITDNIEPIYRGKIIPVDVNHHAGNHQALLIQNNQYYRLNTTGKKHQLDK